VEGGGRWTHFSRHTFWEKIREPDIANADKIFVGEHERRPTGKTQMQRDDYINTSHTETGRGIE